MKKRMLSLLLALCMLLSLFPAVGTTASADTTWGSDYETATEFIIHDIGELLQFQSMVNSGKTFSGKTVTLDEGFSNSDNPLTSPIGTITVKSGTSVIHYFTGIFDGNGKTISVEMTSIGEYSGLFLYLSDATVKNLTITGSVGYVQDEVDSAQYTGGICGFAHNSSFTNCTNDATIKNHDGYTGGICGESSYSTLTDCTNNADITLYGNGSVGGICGYADDGSITSCTNQGDISGSNSFTGGICGCNGDVKVSATIADCVNSGTVTTSAYDSYDEDKKGYIAYCGEKTLYNIFPAIDFTGYCYNQWNQVTYSCCGIGAYVYDSTASTYSGDVQISPSVVSDGRILKLTITATNNSSKEMKAIVGFLADTMIASCDRSTNTVTDDVLKMTEQGITYFAFSDDTNFTIKNISYPDLPKDTSSTTNPTTMSCVDEKCDSAFIAYFADSNNDGITFNAGDTKTFTMYVGVAPESDVDWLVASIKNPIAATGISLDKTETTLTVGQTETLTATVLPENTTSRTVTWTSSDPSVARVSAAGTVTAKKAGTATITATAGGKSATCTVTVKSVVESHVHDWTAYSVDGATFTATCGGKGTCDGATSLSIQAPASVAYDGSEKSCTLSGTTLGDKTDISADNIKYYVQGETEEMSGKPTEAGDYVAKLTIDDIGTAELTFSILDKPVLLIVGSSTAEYDTIQAACDAAGTNTATVKLYRNMTETMITINAGENITLDLNGYVLKGNDGTVIINKGNLTVKSSDTDRKHYFTAGNNLLWTWNNDASETENVVTGGVITGGHKWSSSNYTSDKTCGCAIVSPAGNLTLDHVNLIGNTTEIYGGAVRAATNGTVKVLDTRISHNSASAASGVECEGTSGTLIIERSEISENYANNAIAAVLAMGTVTITDTTITGNKAASLGSSPYIGNVCFNTTKAITIGGKTVITGNSLTNGTINNVYLQSGKVITISNPGSNMKIGVTTATAPTDGSNVNITGTNSDDCRRYFSSDISGYYAVDGDNHVVQLSTTSFCKHPSGWTYSVSGAAFTATCNDCGEERTLTLQAPANIVYDGSAKSCTLSGTDLVEKTGISADNIKYYVKGETAEMSGKPTEAGDYVAKLTIDDIGTAELTFSILDKPVLLIVGSSTTGYDTIQAACDAAGTNTATVKLYRNMNENVIINAGENITLDLNGYVLNSAKYFTEIISVRYGTLTLIDSGVSTRKNYFTYVENSKWTYLASPTEEQIQAAVDLAGMETATLTSDSTVIAVPGGIITGSSTYAILVHSGGTLNFNGGTIAGNPQGLVLKNLNNKGGTCTISGGNIIGNWSYDDSGIAASVDSGSKLTLNSGLIAYNSNLGFNKINGAIRISNSSTFIMTGGTISHNYSMKTGGGVTILSGSTASITGGEIVQNTSDDVGAGISVESTAGTVTLGGDVKITDNKQTDGTVQNVYLASGKTITVSDPGSNMKIGVTTAIKPAYENVNITGTNSADYSSYFFSDVSGYYVVDGDDHVVQLICNHIWNYSVSDAVFTATCGSTCKTTCTLTLQAPANLIYDGTAKSCTLSGTALGGMTGISADSIKYYVKGESTEMSGKPTEAGDYVAKLTIDDIGTAELAFSIKKMPVSLTVGTTTTGYETVQAACDAAGTNTATVTLKQNMTENVTINAGENITLDLNGYVLKGTGSGAVITNNGTLTITDNSTEKQTHRFTPNSSGLWVLDEENGTKTVTGSCITGGKNTDNNTRAGGIYNNYGTLTVTDCNIIGNQGTQGGAIYSRSNSVTLTNCEIAGNITTADGGGIKVNGYHYNTTPEPSLSMDGCKIHDNRAAGTGGGVTCYKSTITVNNTQVTDNYTTSGVGGLYYSTSSITLSGDTIITGNKSGTTDSNLGIATAATVSDPGENMKIGVTTATAPTDGSNVNVTGTNSDDYSDYFFSDVSGYYAVDGDDHVVQLSTTNPCKHPSGWTYSVSGAAFKATCDTCGTTRTLTLQAPASLGYDGSEKSCTLSGTKLGEKTGISADNIKYYVKGETTEMTGKPTAIGDYVAKLTIDGIGTAELAFSIKQMPVFLTVGTTTTGYETIQKACDAAGTNTATVKLNQNMTENVTINAGENITLDLNGYVLKSAANQKSVILNNGTLTVTSTNTERKHYFTEGSNKLWTWNGDATETACVVTGGVITGGYSEAYDDANLGCGIRTTSTLTLDHINIIGNSNRWGGGIRCSAGCTGTIKISDSKIVHNYSNGGGAGISFNSTDATYAMERCDVSDNYCAGNAGGIVVLGTLTMTDCTVSDNYATGVAGGIRLYNSGAKVTINGGTITGNTSVGKGGGVYYENAGSLTLGGNAVITGNTGEGKTENLYLPSGKTATVSNPGVKMNVGVTLANGTGNVTGANSTDYSMYFSSDNASYTVKNDSNTVKLVSTSEISTDVSGATYSASLSLNEKIDMNFKMKNLALNPTENTLAIYVNGEEWTGYSVSNNILSGVLKSIEPNKMSENLHIVIVYNNVQVKNFDYSVRKYCDAVFKLNEINPTEYGKLADLCKALLNYGKWAEDYANELAENGATASTLNDGYAVNFNEYTALPKTARELKANDTVTDAKASLTLDSTVTLNFVLTSSEELVADGEDRNFFILDKNNNQIKPEDITVVEEDGKYTISVDMFASKLSTVYTVKLKDVKTDDFKFTYSVYSYCAEAQAEDGFSDTLKTLCKALHNYGVAVDAYVAG